MYHPFCFLKGNFQDKPMIHGFTTDEGIYFIAQALSEPSYSNMLYFTLLTAMFGDGNDTLVEAQYPPDVSIWTVIAMKMHYCGKITIFAYPQHRLVHAQ